ncbi:MAG TPA: ATP-binding protein [Streptosporangiaceae bacterium]|nr:ATP-binding protein [Streptosporangiaceae bacterium]
MKAHRSLPGQLLVAFSVFAVLVAIAASVGYLAVVRQDSAADQLTGRDYVLQQAGRRMQEGFTTSQIAISSFAMSGSGVFLRPLPAARATFMAQLAILRAGAPARLRAWVGQQARAGSELFAIGDRITRLPAGSAAARALATSTALTARNFYRASTALQEYLAAQVRRITQASTDALTASVSWGGAALAVAVLLVLVASLSTLRTVTWPLHRLADTVRRLTAGDDRARAPVTGSAEVRDVARAVNRQADERDRLRAQEAVTNQLRATARQAGLRIREHLVAGDVIREAWAALDENVDAEVKYLRLVEDERLGAPVGREPAWLKPMDVIGKRLSDDEIAEMNDLFRAQASMVVRDVGGADGDKVPPWLRGMLLRAGVVAQLLTPFGVGSDLLGLVVVQRLHRGQPWTTAEVDLVESIAADLGRGLHHARLFEKENRLVQDLKALDQARSDFFATVSHELRAPLTSIEGYVEMLQEGEGGPVSPAQLGMLQAVDHSAVRLHHLIEDVFMLAKLEAGGFDTVLRPVNLAEVIGGAVEVMRPSLADKGLSFAADYPAAGLVVEGDAGQLDRVLVNLLSNAVKFTPDHGRVALTAGIEDGDVVLRVLDTGIGIPAAEQGELFSRFFRASNVRQQAIPGTGLGLAIVRSIVTVHGGEVSLAGGPESGAVATVRLPLATAAAAAVLP